MYGELLRVTALVGVVVWATALGAAGPVVQPSTDAPETAVTRNGGCTDSGLVTADCRRGPPPVAHAGVTQGPAQFQPPETMEISAQPAGPNRFSVSVSNAEPGRSASVDVPGAPADTDTNGELEELTVHARGGASEYSFDVVSTETAPNLSAITGTDLDAPDAFDSDLVYVEPTTSADSRFELTYSFDVDVELLREHRVSEDALIVTTARNGGWERVSNIRTSRSGGELIVDATVRSSDPVAVGLQHPNITVTGVERHDPPLLPNQTERLDLTVRNDGHRSGTEAFSLETDDDRILANTTVSVPVGETRTVSVPVRFDRSGSWSIEVGEYETTIPVLKPQANIAVTGLSVSRDRIQPGETATAEATVTNSGRADGSTRVQFRAFGEVVDSRTVHVRAGETRTVTFDQSIAAPGEYRLSVGNYTRKVTVAGSTVTTTDAPPFESTPTPAGTGTFDDTAGLLLPAVGAGVVLLFGIVAIGRVVSRR